MITSTLETNYTNNVDNDTVKVIKPNMVIEKISLNKTICIGNQTVFTIIVKNTGDCDLNDIFVVEKVPEGLVYNSFKGKNWYYNNGKFTYNTTLKAGESTSFDIIFDTVMSGNFTNVVVAGSDLTGNKTANNTTEVIDKPNIPENNTDNNTNITNNIVHLSIEDHGKDVPIDSKSINVKNATGNPILILLMVLALLGLRPLKGKK